MTNEQQPDYRLQQFYAAESGTAGDGSIFAELQGLEHRYSKPSLIARGGLKRITKVFDNKTNRYVAMAQLRPDSPEELYEPFLREARLTALLEHPNIIAVHDIGVGADGQPYFTMELKVGDSLAEILNQLGKRNREYLARYDRETLLGIFIKICDAVAFAHSRNVLHLDLKPENIQVGDFGEVIVCDWGLGKIIGSDDDAEFDELLLNPDLLNNMTLAGTIKGTPGYMAPEQAASGEKTKQTDIYALGAILYTVLAHAAPLDGDRESMLEKTREGKIEPPRDRFPARDIPASLDAVTMKAMALEPADRYAAVVGLEQEVCNYLSGFATRAENAGLGKQLRLLYLRNRRFCHSVGIGVLAVTTIATVAFLQLNEKERAAIEALRLYETEKEAVESITEDYLADLIDVNRQFIQKQEFDAALAKIDQATRKDPKNLKAWLEKGYTHFMMQQFKTAAESFERAGDHGLVYQLALEYAAHKPDEELLEGTELANLIRRLGRKPLRLKLMMFDSSVRKDRVEHSLGVRAMVEMANPDWREGRFEYNPAARSLALSGRGLHVLSSGGGGSSKCLLSTLDLRSLDLRGSEIVNLKHLANLNIEQLDLRDTPVGHLKTAKNMKYLQELIVSPGRFPDKEIELLRRHIDVTVSE